MRRFVEYPGTQPSVNRHTTSALCHRAFPGTRTRRKPGPAAGAATAPAATRTTQARVEFMKRHGIVRTKGATIRSAKTSRESGAVVAFSPH